MFLNVRYTELSLFAISRNLIRFRSSLLNIIFTTSTSPSDSIVPLVSSYTRGSSDRKVFGTSWKEIPVKSNDVMLMVSLKYR